MGLEVQLQELQERISKPRRFVSNSSLHKLIILQVMMKKVILTNNILTVWCDWWLKAQHSVPQTRMLVCCMCGSTKKRSQATEERWWYKFHFEQIYQKGDVCFTVLRAMSSYLSSDIPEWIICALYIKVQHGTNSCNKYGIHSWRSTSSSMMCRPHMNHFHIQSLGNQLYIYSIVC